MSAAADRPARAGAAAGLRAAAVLLACVALSLGMRASGAPPVMADSMALVLLAIGFWALAVLPEPLTGLLFLLGAVTLTGLEPAVVFSGFTSSAFWLIFAGTVLSASATRTGLSHWLAGRVLARRFAAVGYRTRVGLVVAFSAGLALILPSTLARVAILLPLVLALCDRVGYPAGGRGRAGLVLAAAIGTYIVPITFLPANLPNIVLAGSLESIYGITLTFGSYLLLHFPVIGLVKGVALVLILTAMFAEPPRPGAAAPGAEAADLSDPGRRLMLVMSLTLVLWTTDFLHGISPAWIGLGAAILCLMPFAGILGLKQMPCETAFPMLLYLGAVLGIGGVMTQSGAGAALSELIVGNLPLAETGNAVRLALLAFTAAATALVTTMPVAPAMTVPLFGDIAAQTGWTVEAVGMAQVLGYATPLMPYQLPPLMLAMAMAGVAMRDATRVLLVLAALTTPVTLVLAHLWWQALGWY
jgi:di/tricarboxylate transporter